MDKEWIVEATIKIRTSFYCDTKEKRRKKHINIYQNYAKTYILIAVPTVTRLRTYIAIQRIEPYKAESEVEE